jgi:hypothetical protein
MSISPKYSRWFYEYTERNHRLHGAPEPPPPDASSPARKSKPRSADGWMRHVFANRERQFILDLLKAHSGKISTVADKFTEATGVTVSNNVIYSVRDEAIKNGQLPAGLAQTNKRFTDQQRQFVLDLLKAHPDSLSTVAEKFAEATGVTITKPTIRAIGREAAAEQVSLAPPQPQKRFTDDQKQIIIDLIKAHPRNPATVSEAFAEACPGFTVTRAGVCGIRDAAIKAGKLKL